MKIGKVVAAAVILGVASTFALAQTPAPQAEALFQQYLNSLPELRRNPALMNDPGYLSSHPGFAHFLQMHPYVHRQAFMMGAYDRYHQWRDPDWWFENDPDWMWEHHPEWADGHPEWRDEGDFDEEHHWRDRDWWWDHHREWVEAHHPRWAKHHERHPDEAEGPGQGRGHAYGHDNAHGNGHGHHD